MARAALMEETDPVFAYLSRHDEVKLIRMRLGKRVTRRLVSWSCGKGRRFAGVRLVSRGSLSPCVRPRFVALSDLRVSKGWGISAQTHL